MTLDFTFLMGILTLIGTVLTIYYTNQKFGPDSNKTLADTVSTLSKTVRDLSDELAELKSEGVEKDSRIKSLLDSAQECLDKYNKLAKENKSYLNDIRRLKNRVKFLEEELKLEQEKRAQLFESAVKVEVEEK